MSGARFRVRRWWQPALAFHNCGSAKDPENNEIFNPISTAGEAFYAEK
jgi:hypothetical protein